LVLRHDLQGLAEQRHGLTLRPPLSSVLGGDLEKPKGVVNVSSLPPMMGQQAGGLLDSLAGHRLDKPRYRGVPLAAGRRPGERGVGHLTDEHVFEQLFVVALDLAWLHQADELTSQADLPNPPDCIPAIRSTLIRDLVRRTDPAHIRNSRGCRHGDQDRTPTPRRPCAA
jgi:hypothetical protein